MATGEETTAGGNTTSETSTAASEKATSKENTTTGEKVVLEALPNRRPGDLFPDIAPVLLHPGKEAPHLGLPPSRSRFSLGEITPEFLVLTIQDLNAPQTTEMTDSLRNLLRRVDAEATLSGRLRVLGIAAGSNARSVAKFVRKNALPYPLVADGGKRLHSRIGSPALPAVYLLRREADGSRRTLWSGATVPPGTLLGEVRKALEGPALAIDEKPSPSAGTLRRPAS